MAYLNDRVLDNGLNPSRAGSEHFFSREQLANFEIVKSAILKWRESIAE